MRLFALVVLLAGCGPTPVQTCTLDADARDAAVARQWLELDSWAKTLRRDDERVPMQRYITALKVAYSAEPGLTCEVAP